MVPFESLDTVSYSHSLVTIDVLYHLLDKARWPKIATGPRRNFTIRFGTKTRMVWLPDGDKV